MVWPRSAYLIDVLFNRFYNVYMGFVYNGMGMFTMFTKKKKRKRKSGTDRIISIKLFISLTIQ